MGVNAVMSRKMLQDVTCESAVCEASVEERGGAAGAWGSHAAAAEESWGHGHHGGGAGAGYDALPTMVDCRRCGHAPPISFGLKRFGGNGDMDIKFPTV